MNCHLISVSIIIIVDLIFVLSIELVDNDKKDVYYTLTILANIPQTIRMNGFDSENHTVITNDGYRLQLYRIVNPYRLSNKIGYPILLFNGLTESPQKYISTTNGWFNRTTGIYTEYDNQFENRLEIDCRSDRLPPIRFGRNIAFTLAACGFDVWLTNVRDNIHEASHLRFNIDDSRYWNITLDHYTLDAMANIDYVRRENIKRSTTTVGIVCYSLSCLSIFQLMSIDEKYNDLIRPLFLLAPNIYMRSMLSLPIIFLGSLEPVFRNIPQSTVDVVPILPYLANQLEKNEFLRIMYMFSLMLLAGSNNHEFIPENLYRLMAHFPNTVSLQVFSHIGQRYSNHSDHHLYRFDYGSKENLNVYGTLKPPYYDLNEITNQCMILWHGSSDLISDDNDIERLQQDLSGMIVFPSSQLIFFIF